MSAAIIARVGLDTRNITKDTAALEKAVVAGTKRTVDAAEKLQSKLAAHNAKVHQRAAADIEKAYRESAVRVQKATELAYARMDKSASLRQAALHASLRRAPGPAGGGSIANHPGVGGHGGKGGGGLPVTRIIGDSLNALTGSTGNVMKANFLAHFPRLAGPAALAGMFAKSAADQVALHGENNKMEGLLGRTTTAYSDRFKLKAFRKGPQLGTPEAHGEEALHARREALAEQSKKLGEGRTFFGGITERLLGQQGSSFRLQQEADEKRAEIDATLAGRLHEQIAARETLLHKSQLAGELAQHHLEAEEKLAALRDEAASGKIGNAEYAQQRKAVEQNLAAEDEASTLRHTEAQNEIAQQERLNYIRRQGDDEHVKAAYAATDAAKEQMRLARNDEEKAAARAQINAAELAWDLAKKARDIEREGQASALELAGLRGQADQLHMAALIAEDRLIQARQTDARTTPDEQRDLAIRAAQNQAARERQTHQLTNAAFDAGSAIIDAGTGRGAAEQQRAVREKYAQEKSRLTFLQNSDQTKNDPGAIAAQTAKVNDLRKQYLDLADAKAKGLREAGAELNALDAELQRHGEIAQYLRTQHGLEEQIVQAKKDGDTALAAQLQNQQQLTAQVQREKIGRQLGDRDKATLGGLAEHAHNRAGQQARRVQRLEKRADRFRDRGHEAESKRLRAEATRIRGRIGPLKDDEKADALLQQQLTQLEEIALNTKGVRNAR